MKKVIIYGFAGSTYVRTAIMTCIEKDVDYELEGFEYGSARHLELHPFMKMPAAKIEGNRYYETLAITALIDDLSGSRLQPKDPVEKATMLKWVSSAIDDLYPILVKGTMADEPVSAESVSSVSKVLLMLNQEMQAYKYFLNTEQLRLSDLFLYPMVNFAAANIPDFSALTADLTYLRKWLSAMDERDCVIQTVPEAA